MLCASVCQDVYFKPHQPPHQTRRRFARQKSQREADGLMLVEGYEEVSLALASGIKPKTLYYSPALFAKGMMQRWSS